MTPKMTARQARFVQEYLLDLNASAAARRAGYAPRNANVTGPRLLSNASIAAAVDAAMAERSARTAVSADRVVQELAKIAFLDARLLFDENGLPRPISELDDDTAAAIAGLEVSVTEDDNGRVTRVAKIKIADKLAALEKLGKHLGLYEPRNAPGTAESPIAVLIRHAQGTALPVVANPPVDDEEEDGWPRAA